MYSRFAGIFLMGIVIKLMDDYLDENLDMMKGKKNFAVLLGRGLLPYSLVLIIISLYLNFQEVVSLFFASYILGMTHDYSDRLPSSLMGWQESLIVFTLSILLTSFYNTITALILIFLLQLFDDFIDYQKDDFVNEKNFIIGLGKVPGMVLILILSLISFKFFSIKFFYFSSSIFLFYYLESMIHKKYNSN